MMVAFKSLLAAALLTGAWDAPLPENPAAAHAFVAPTLRDLAIRLEIMDRKETDFILAHPEDFAEHVRLLQDRFLELRDAPPVGEATRFPSRDLVNDLLNFNRAFYQALTERMEVDTVHTEELEAARTETTMLYNVWDAVRDARCEFYHVNVRRQALLQLRRLIGDRAFYTGELPPYVPLWRFPTAE
jgi:hypothetical protein